MKIYTDSPEGVTVVKNAFIDQYMPQANGEFVKVYLYLLRCANTGRDLSLSSIADALDHTDKDIQRALAYWEKQDLIHIKASVSGVIQSITFSDLPSTSEELPADLTVYSSGGQTAAAPAPAVSAASSAPPAAAPSAPSAAASISRDKLAQLSEQQDVRQIFFVAEQYLQRPLTSTEQTDLIYYYDTLHFSSDLIIYLLEYCISKGAFNRHYMQRVALGWAESGITTVTQARQESNLYNKNYFTILNTFGIKGRNPAQPEIEIMSRWFREYDFTLDIIIEACSRTIRQIHQPSFEYANKILKQWNKNGVTSLDDVRRLDQQRTEEQQRKAEQKKTEPQPAKSSGNRFNNFTQREYDYSQLEKQLLNH